MVKIGVHDRCVACSDSGAHFAQMGLTKHRAVREVFPGSCWQRCVAHLMREAEPRAHRGDAAQGGGDSAGGDARRGLGPTTGQERAWPDTNIRNTTVFLIRLPIILPCCLNWSNLIEKICLDSKYVFKIEGWRSVFR